MKKIFLCCAAGMSTSMVMNKMKQAAAAQGIAVDIIAVSMDDFDRTLPNYDCCLLGRRLNINSKNLTKRPLRWARESPLSIAWITA